jgi:hypothetical protein
MFSPSYGHAATLLVDGTRFEISVGFVDAGEWYLFANGDGGERALPNVDATRELLRQLDSALHAMPGVANVQWVDRVTFDGRDCASSEWHSSPVA